MTDAAVDVALRLRLDDRATPALDNAARRAMENERKGAEASEQAQRRMRAGYQATSQAREVLGVRSEQRIQREIAATEAAYKRLAATGKLSATEQARALDATRAKVTALTNEMGKLTAAQEKAARGAQVMQYGGMAVAAGAAGAATGAGVVIATGAETDPVALPPLPQVQFGPHDSTAPTRTVAGRAPRTGPPSVRSCRPRISRSPAGRKRLPR
jgi:hypothetical protein